MATIRLTRTAKAFIAATIVGVTGFSLLHDRGLLDKLAPAASGKRAASSVPPFATLPGEAAKTPGPGCAGTSEVRFEHFAWNAQMGLMLATGGPSATEGSAMCERGLNLRLIREDSTDKMQADMLVFAEALKKGEADPKVGAHFVAIMGDGAAQFLKGVNDKLLALGPEYTAAVVGSAGYSRGEDKLMGPPSWRDSPEAARGGLVAGVLRDGDWNIALKWLGDNRIPNNPDESAYDPDALNWVGASDYIDAAQKYVSGYCADLVNVKSGKKEKHCVDAVVTWTPGDVIVAEKRGGAVPIVSTREYRSQMPNVIIGNRKWMSAHRDMVKGMLSAIFEAGDRIKSDDKALREAASVSAVVYKEKDAAYWYRYFNVQRTLDQKGLSVELGGSTVNNLADNGELFGLTKGALNAFAATYTVFGEVVRSQYPALLPSFPAAAEVTDTSYLEDLLAAGTISAADVRRFDEGERVKQVLSRRAWDIRFASGSAVFTADAQRELTKLRDDLVIASGAVVEIHGHTDAQGTADRNMALSEQRAFAVKRWLTSASASAFPEGRVRVFAHGQGEPVDSNGTDEGRAKNRRVIIVIGASGV